LFTSVKSKVLAVQWPPILLVCEVWYVSLPNSVP